MRRGFTLIEVLVTLAIIAVAASVAAPAMRRTSSQVQLTAAQLHGVLLWSWRQACERGESVRFALDPRTGEYWVGAEHRWPADLWLNSVLDLADGLTIGPDSALLSVRVQPNGRSTSAVIRIMRALDTAEVVTGGGMGAPGVTTSRHGPH